MSEAALQPIAIERVLTLPGQVTSTSLLLPETLEINDWLRIGERLKAAERGVQWWLGDWLRYGERKWGEMYAQAVDTTEYSYGVCANAVYVANRFDFSRRREKLAWGHHQEVASLPPDIADRLLDLAEEHGLSARELRSEVRQLKNAIGELPSGETCTVSDLQTLVVRGMKFGTVYADPPWPYDNQGTRAATGNHYGVMTLEDIAALPIRDLAAENAHLHFWTTNGFLFESRRIMEKWGFEYKSCFVWVKPEMGIGNYWRVSHEFLLFGVRGSTPFRDRGLKSWLECGRGPHSAKPEQIRQYIERASPPAYLELFGRRCAENWTVWGNQIERALFDQGIPHFEL